MFSDIAQTLLGLVAVSLEIPNQKCFLDTCAHMTYTGQVKSSHTKIKILINLPKVKQVCFYFITCFTLSGRVTAQTFVKVKRKMRTGSFKT